MLYNKYYITIIIIINIIIINIFFHFIVEEPEAQKEKVICYSLCIDAITRDKIRIQYGDLWVLKDHFL